MNDSGLRPNKLEAFLAEIPIAVIVRDAARRAGRDKTEITALLETFINETYVTLGVVEDHLDRQKNMLEVGAGLCLFSLFLRKEGFAITALEPALGGFGIFDILRRTILEHYSNIDLPVLAIPASDLNVSEHGHFDLIFSSNVIEHIPNWQGALRSMLDVLTLHGVMVHACPNYTVPYEPHYGVPVFRRLPKLSKKLFLSADADEEIWGSLSFICHKQVRSFAARQGLSVVFKRGLFYQALTRLQRDAVFRHRHKGLVSNMADILNATGLLGLLRYLPPAMSTPMMFEIRRTRKLPCGTVSFGGKGA